MEAKKFDYYLRKYKHGTRPIGNGQYITIDKHDRDVVYSCDPNGWEWHRLDGPAFIPFDKDDFVLESAWYINDYDVTDEIIVWASENSIDLDNLSEVDKALIKLTWADYYGK